MSRVSLACPHYAINKAERYKIYREVWRAWVKGMETYFRKEKVRELWDCESKTDSYYGLESDPYFSAMLDSSSKPETLTD